MSAAAPWSVKGIDPKAREIAKDLARRSGLTLGDWLNRMIMEDSAEAAEFRNELGAKDGGPIAPEEFGRLREALERLSERIESAEHRSTLAVSGIDQTVAGLLARLEGAEREQVAVAARFEGALEEIKSEQSRAEARAARSEDGSGQPRSVEALRALETALGKVATHLYESETKTRETLIEMRAELGGIAGRVDRLDEAGAAPPEEMIDGVVTRIVQRLEEAEARTSDAIRSLEASVSEFDQRLKAAESRGEGGGAAEQRLEELATELLRNFDTAREEMASKLEETAEARFSAMERSFQEVTGQVQAAEKRSTHAMEQVGREVLRVAEALGRRMEGVEARSAGAMEQVSGEVSRIADTMDGRLHKAEQVQAESLERLGAEITRITERLADRIANAERRSAQAIDDVGEQVARVTERLNQRHERASTDLADRIRQSEERTAKLLEEAREKIDLRLSGTERRLTEQASPPPAAPSTEPSGLFAEPDLPPGPFAQEPSGPSAWRRGGGFVPLQESVRSEAEKSPFEGDDFDPAELFESFEQDLEPAPAEPHALSSADEQQPLAEPEHDLLSEPDEEMLAEPEDRFFDEPALTPRGRDFAAEAELEHASPEAEPFAGRLADYTDVEPEPEADLPPEATDKAVSTRELIAQARAAAKAAAQTTEPRAKGGGLFSGFGLGAKKRKQKGDTLKTAVMIAATAAVLGVGAAGVIVYRAQLVSHPRPTAQAATALTVNQGEPAAASAPAAQAAVALAPQMNAPAAAPGGVDLAGLYADAVRRIEAKDGTGLPDLKRAANLGYPPAQFYLAKLYEGGDAGLQKDVSQARAWTQRAAENGDRKAMHNLALYYFEGTGGPKNLTVAAQWFRRAADLGLVDSQFNLARLYQGGFGVAQNAAEAYKWYLIAARAGDGESRAAADRLKGGLSTDAQATAERAAQSFRAETAVASTDGVIADISRQGDVALAQRALAKLGYYRGPADGVLTPALKLAIGSFQRDKGLSSTGLLDSSTSQRLSRAAG
jgi:localization factor PodJL